MGKLMLFAALLPLFAVGHANTPGCRSSGGGCSTVDSYLPGESQYAAIYCDVPSPSQPGPTGSCSRTVDVAGEPWTDGWESSAFFVNAGAGQIDARLVSDGLTSLAWSCVGYAWEHAVCRETLPYDGRTGPMTIEVDVHDYICPPLSLPLTVPQPVCQIHVRVAFGYR